MDLENIFKIQRSKINQRLLEIVPATFGPDKTLFEAARYSLNASGKRLRPLLTLATVQILGGSESIALTPACAVELIHTYSLIHDDLPCMDNDDFRRGKPTLHKAFPEGIAVLAGDFLLTHAFTTILNSEGLDDKQKLKLIAALASNSGGEGMIAGQIMDMESENKEISLETLQQIHSKKTGTLIACALQFGAIITNSSDAIEKCLIKYGELIGLAFQITDDLIDITNSQAKHGKTTSSDITNHKSTYVSLMGFEKAKKSALELVEEAKMILKDVPGNTQILQNIADYIVTRSV